MRISFIKRAKIMIIFTGISMICLNTLNLFSVMFSSGEDKAFTPVVLPYVIVHIDLKGNPPKLEYLEYLLPKLKEYGVNGLLMEYEDMFPFDPKLNLSTKDSYSSRDLTKFLIKATRLKLEIIPLIQTFGHMEYVLKLQKYKHLRENPFYFDSICPSHHESISLIKNMLRQVVQFHNNITTLKFIHIGCDEVYHINQCRLCRERKMDDMDIFVNHLQAVVTIIKEISPLTKVIIWDDMFRGMKSALPQAELYDTEIVYWDYKPRVILSHLDLIKYRRKFSNVWIASAFKGADGRRNIIPNLYNRFLNHHSWLSSIYNYKFGGENFVYTFGGIILTGWSKYSHMDAPCELLPASIRSLIMNLLVINAFKIKSNSTKFILNANTFYKERIEKEFNAILDFNSINDMYAVKSDELLKILKLFKELNEEINKGFTSAGTDFPMIKFNTTNYYINRINRYNSVKWCKDSLRNLVNIENRLEIVMSYFFMNHTIKEYIEYLIFPNKERLLQYYYNII